MKFQIRDAFFLILLVAVSLAWWRDRQQMKLSSEEMQRMLRYAQQEEKSQYRKWDHANAEADLLAEECQRLQSLLKASLNDQREWFELKVLRKELIAIQPVKESNNYLTLDTIHLIESRTGLTAERLRHFLTPIGELKLNKD